VYLPPAKSQPTFFVRGRGVDFFHQKLAASLDGQFGSNFWSKFVLQLTHSEASVRHAIAAISVTYRDVESALLHPAGYVDANPEAHQEWITAIKSLSHRIQEHPDSNLVPLVCCLLFTCIDFLRGNVETSFIHVQSGFNILAALRQNSEPHRTSNDLKAIEDHIVPMFARLNILYSLAGCTTPPAYAPTADEVSPQEDITESRRRLVELSITCIDFIKKAGPKSATCHIDVDELVEQVKLQTRLDTWRSQLDELLKRMQAAGNPAKQDAVHLLLVYYKVISIWLRVCTTAAESATDSYHTDFEELVYYAEQVSAGMATPQPLSFDIQILGPLYYAALKCRYPATRRRALRMLQHAPRREGLWNAHHAYVTAKRVIELEERHLNAKGLPDEASRVLGLPLPNDDSRIWNPSRVPFEFRKFDYSIVPSPAYPGTLEAVFQTKPWGLSGERQTIKEYIAL
jgi:hypothetical protein